MSAKKAKKGKPSPNIRKTRKQLRKEERKNKKVRRHEYYTNRRKPGQFVLLKNKSNAAGNVDNSPVVEEVKKVNLSKSKKSPNVKSNKLGDAEVPSKSSMLDVEQVRVKEKKEQLKLQQEMKKQRKKQLLEANLEEDRNIKRLEKQLKLNKRKSKAIPAPFTRDGLDFLLEVCDPENMKNSALSEQQLVDANDDFEEDLVLMTGGKKNKIEKIDDKSENESDSEDDFSEDENEETTIKPKDRKTLKKKNFNQNRKPPTDSDVSDDSEADSDGLKENSEDLADFDDEEENSEESEQGTDVTNIKTNKRRSKIDRNDIKRSRKAESELDESSDFDENDLNDGDEGSVEENGSINNFSGSEDLDGGPEEEERHNGTWTDIYGRLRAKDGSIITEKTGKYVPPAARLMSDNSSDKARALKLEKLKKQLKGLFNRLAESNMHSIAKQIEELYMNNSRYDMNSTITNLVTETLVSKILAPERLLMEHVLLIIILHANVGTEVGAHFLQTIIKQFDDQLNNATTVENKKLDNLVIILAQLYNFKMFDSKLIYEIIDKLSGVFEEKHVECILHILKNVGFNLRKDNPLALKELILALQKKASSASDELKDNSRVKFMLDVLLAIKNNNVTKIPNYDTSYSEHLKKIMKGFIRKGNYVTQLNISLEDLLKVEEKGKWWVVGSAWIGNASEDNTTKNKPENPNTFSQKLLELASKQRMNTDTRKNIFCILMSAEDYLDAFEKLLRLSLKNQQEREIIHVILHCCLQEKTYNPYYATLAQKFCEYDRKYQMTIKYSIWDKLKALKEHSASQISHLAKLLSHLFLEKGLPISTLKIVQFSELDKVTLRFIRQILLGILLHDDLDDCKSVFDKVAQSDKLKMFKESLRLFLHHFLLRNLESQGIPEDKKELLQQRVRVVEKALSGKESKLRY